MTTRPRPTRPRPTQRRPTQRRRRQVAVTQATIARAVRAAQAAGEQWQVVIEGDAVRLFQGPPPIPMSPPGNGRGLGIVP
jgi:hypothetical protein